MEPASSRGAPSVSALDARIQETVLTQWVEAFNARNLDGMLSCLSVAVEFRPLKLGGARDCYHGHRGVREWFAQLDGPGSAHRIALSDVRDLGDGRVLAV